MQNIKDLIVLLQQAVDGAESNANKQEVFDAGFKAGLRCAVNCIEAMGQQKTSTDVEIDQSAGDLSVYGTLSDVEVKVFPSDIIDESDIFNCTSDDEWTEYSRVDAK
jgi:hypothetical protein